MSIEEAPKYFEKNYWYLCKPSADELRKYFMQILVQEKEEKDPNEYLHHAEPNKTEPQTTPECLELAHAAMPAVRQNFEGPLYAEISAKERGDEDLKRNLHNATNTLLRMQAAARSPPTHTPIALFR